MAVGGLLTAALMQGVSLPIRHALIAVGRTVSVLAVTAGAAATCLLGASAVVAYGGGIAAVAWNSAIVSAGCLALLVVLCWQCQEHYWTRLMAIAVVSCYLAGGIVAVGGMGAGVGQILAAAVWCAPAVAIVARQLRVSGDRPTSGPSTYRTRA